MLLGTLPSGEVFGLGRTLKATVIWLSATNPASPSVNHPRELWASYSQSVS